MLNLESLILTLEKKIEEIYSRDDRAYADGIIKDRVELLENIVKALKS